MLVSAGHWPNFCLLRLRVRSFPLSCLTGDLCRPLPTEEQLALSTKLNLAFLQEDWRDHAFFAAHFLW